MRTCIARCKTKSSTIDKKTELGSLGMDSMLAAEFRTFIFHTFAADVPFTMLLYKATTVVSISEVVVKAILEVWGAR